MLTTSLYLQTRIRYIPDTSSTHYDQELTNFGCQIITLPDLIPERTFPPMSHAAKPPIAFDRPATVDDVADCFVHYLENNLVGAIATRHLFVSDRSPLHGRDPIAIRLAELHR